jgi:hypothetical protein
MTLVRRPSFLLFLGLLLTASAVMASDIVTLQLTGTSGYTLPQTDEQVYPYTALLNGVDTITIGCDDFYHNSSVLDPPWDAYRTYLSSMDVSNTRFGNVANGFQLYQEIGYLAAKFSAVSQLQQAEINWAIWEMTSDAIGKNLSYSFDPNLQNAIQAYINDAIANYSNGPAPAWMDLVIYTPVNSPDQEMIEVVTPEPTTMLLLGSGIAGLWSQRRRIL